jgi:hypothetical protein
MQITIRRRKASQYRALFQGAIHSCKSLRIPFSKVQGDDVDDVIDVIALRSKNP